MTPENTSDNVEEKIKALMRSSVKREDYGERFDLQVRSSTRSVFTIEKAAQRYIKNSKLQQVPADVVALSRAITAYIRKNSGRSRYMRLADNDHRPLIDKPVIVIPEKGYLFSERDKARVWKFNVELRNLLFAETGDRAANLVMVNYTKRRPFVSLITTNEDYQVDPDQYDPELMDLWSECVGAFCGNIFVGSDPSTWGLQNKKSTSLGFPYETVRGDPVDREASSWNIARRDGLPLSKASMLIDNSRVKQEWRNDPNGSMLILDNQMELIARGRGASKIEPSNIGDYVENNIITVANPAFRENNPDTADCELKNITLRTVLSGKDRFFSTFVSGSGKAFEHGIDPMDKLGHKLVGTLDKKELNAVMMTDDSGNPWYGYDENQRGIYPTNNVMHSNGTTLARGMLHKAEHSEVGHPSENAAVVKAWTETGEALRLAGYESTLLAMDCDNAEVTVTSNEDVFIRLVPAQIREYLRLCAFTVLPMETVFRVEKFAYCSAVWYTTWFHVLKGNFEGLRVAMAQAQRRGAKIPRAWQRKVVHAVAAVLFYHEDDRDDYLRKHPAVWEGCRYVVKLTQDGTYLYSPRLGTDDVTSFLAWKKGAKALHVTQEDARYYKRTMLNVESGEVIKSFGMEQTPLTLRASVSNTFRGIFTSERMGFYARDVFATWVRLETSPYKEMVEHLLKKHFGVTIADYAREATRFPAWLQATGVEGIGDMFNEYSPKDRLLIGSLVEGVGLTASELRSRSTRVEPEVCERYQLALTSYFFTNVRNEFGKMKEFAYG